MASSDFVPTIVGPNPTPERKCVLIVEDNPLNMKLFSAMIDAQGYDVLQATDGCQGLDMAQRQHPDLIIMDIQLPDISGTEVTQSLKSDQATRHIPIIATSAFVLRGDEERIRASGCDAYMAKPIAISQFLQLIDTLIMRVPPVKEASPERDRAGRPAGATGVDR
jgi:two-component system cell cycle response regulator DivK